MAYAGAKFTISMCKAVLGEPNVIECSYVQSTVTDSPFFSTPVLIGVIFLLYLILIFIITIELSATLES